MMDECENGMDHNGEWANSNGLVILVEGLDVFTLGSVAACGTASFTLCFILFLSLATF
jgi:hypothetical protein